MQTYDSYARNYTYGPGGLEEPISEANKPFRKPKLTVETVSVQPARNDDELPREANGFEDVVSAIERDDRASTPEERKAEQDRFLQMIEDGEQEAIWYAIRAALVLNTLRARMESENVAPLKAELLRATKYVPSLLDLSRYIYEADRGAMTHEVLAFHRAERLGRPRTGKTGKPLYQFTWPQV